MNLDVGVQNKNLASAASAPKDTSHRTLTSNKYAAKVASSKNVSSGPDNSGPKSTQHEGRRRINRSDNIKGSMEGLDKSSRADIVMNGSGYLNPDLQTARNTKSHATHTVPNFMQSSFTNSKNSDIINNMTNMSSKDSSSSIIRGMNKRNNMI
jgi:hypothetical protein